jgi:hypothetical protein
MKTDIKIILCLLAGLQADNSQSASKIYFEMLKELYDEYLERKGHDRI